MRSMHTEGQIEHPQHGGAQKKTGSGSKGNPRYKNGNFRRKIRARFKAQGAPCGICHGRLGEIHYDEPSDSKHPLSFVVDEIKPVSRWKEFGYSSPEAACMDISNLQPAHWACNSRKSNKIAQNVSNRGLLVNLSDGIW